MRIKEQKNIIKHVLNWDYVKTSKNIPCQKKFEIFLHPKSLRKD